METVPAFSSSRYTVRRMVTPTGYGWAVVGPEGNIEIPADSDVGQKRSWAQSCADAANENAERTYQANRENRCRYVPAEWEGEQ